MDAFTTHTGIGVPLRRGNVDTDQIIPAVYLKRVTRTGFEDGLFAAWRGEESFVLNQPAYRAGSAIARLLPSPIIPPFTGVAAWASAGTKSSSTPRRSRPSWKKLAVPSN